jgi:hypothetical protein
MAAENIPAFGRSAEEVRNLSDEEFDQWVAQVKREGRKEALTEVTETLDHQAKITAKGGAESDWRLGRVDGLEFAATLVHRLNLNS